MFRHTVLSIEVSALASSRCHAARVLYCEQDSEGKSGQGTQALLFLFLFIYLFSYLFVTFVDLTTLPQVTEMLEDKHLPPFPPILFPVGSGLFSLLHKLCADLLSRVPLWSEKVSVVSRGLGFWTGL